MSTNKTLYQQFITNEPSGWDLAEELTPQFYNAEINGVIYPNVVVDSVKSLVVCYDEEGNTIKTFKLIVFLEEQSTTNLGPVPELPSEQS